MLENLKRKRAFAKYRKNDSRPKVDAHTRSLYTDQASRPEPTRRQFTKHITPQDNDLARALNLSWEDLTYLADGGTIRRVCPAHNTNGAPVESLTVILGAGGVLLLSCDKHCPSSEIVGALRAGPQ